MCRREPSNPTAQMEVIEPTPEKAVERTDADGGTNEGAGADALRSMQLREIMSGMSRRAGMKRMPSALARSEGRRRRRRTDGPPGRESTERTTRVSTPPPSAGTPANEVTDEVVAPQVTLDQDGNIVIDQSSLVVSAGTAGNAELDRGDITTVENHAYSSHITSATYSKRERSTRWEAAETDCFYAALRKFGTDFLLMKSAFPNRTRKQLKLKFKREEKEFPDRIDEALNGPKMPMSPLNKTMDSREINGDSDMGDRVENGQEPVGVATVQPNDEDTDTEKGATAESNVKAGKDAEVEDNAKAEEVAEAGRAADAEKSTEAEKDDGAGKDGEAGQTEVVVVEEARPRSAADDVEEAENSAMASDRDDESDRWSDTDDSDG